MSSGKTSPARTHDDHFFLVRTITNINIGLSELSLLILLGSPALKSTSVMTCKAECRAPAASQHLSSLKRRRKIHAHPGSSFMASTISVRPDRTILGGKPSGSVHHPTRRLHVCSSSHVRVKKDHRPRWCALLFSSTNRRSVAPAPQAGSRADDSAPYEMSLENALKVLGISEGASFEDIVRAKNSIIAGCKDDLETIAKVEAAYDMLLMQSLSHRRAGKVVSSSIRYADVKPMSSPRTRPMPQWLQNTMRNSPVSMETPSTGELGIQAGVYGALMVLTYVNGASSSVSSYAGADVPGLLLATGFGASLYFITKKNVKLGKATVITIGGLAAGAVVGSAVENWLQVDIVPFLGIHSPATVVSEFILLSQFLFSLYLR